MNNFAGDANCKGWWQFEPEALAVDTMVLNDWTSLAGDPVVDVVQRHEGLGSLYLDGSSWLELADASLGAGFPLKSGDANKIISVAGRVRFVSVTNEIVIFKKGYQDDTFTIGLKEDAGDPEWAIGVGTGVYPTIEWHCSGYTPVVNRWYHFGVTYRDDTKAYVMRVYDYAAAAVVFTMSGNGTADVQVTGQALIIGYPNIGDSYFTGWLDELVVFNDILSTDEIDQIRAGTYIMELPAAGDPPADTPLAVYVPEVITMAPWYGIACWPIKERLRFNTEILQSHDRTEQRIAKRMGIPRQVVTIPFLLRDYTDAAKLDNILHEWGKDRWPVPIWWEAREHADNMAAGAGTITIDTSYADYRDGSHAMIFQRDNAEVVTVDTVAAGSLTLDGVTANAYAGSKWIMPCRYGYILDVADKEQYVGGAAKVDITFAIQDNDTAIAGWTAPMTYDGYDILTKPSYMGTGHTHTEGHDPDTVLIDAPAGRFEVRGNSTYNEVTQEHVWQIQTRADAWALRQLLHAKKGRQGVFLIPTFRNDITLSRAYTAGLTIYVVNRGYMTMGLNALRTYVALRPPGGAIQVRQVTNIAAVSATEEAFTLDGASATIFPAGSHLCWVDICRLADDNVAINWRKWGSCSCSADLVRVTE
ncbi:MAG: hypothetical protein A2Y76_01615 [Planctomycetes bacterium RBG_13_60_9]|nr:MAG: hypothetical protein A2Y76_01615 [Planctomycetes bacterium RBG_13_60_9]